MNHLPGVLPDGRRLNLLIQVDRIAVCRLDRHDSLPTWDTQGDFFSITRTTDELSIVCPESSIPDGIRADRGWRALRVADVLDLSLVGILASLTVPLARAGISLFVVSTFDTDYLLVKEHDLVRAVEALRADGHVIL
jgi:hypothetical protein